MTHDETGKRYGRWTVIAFAANHNGKSYWKCRCDCGVEKDVMGKNLRNGRSQSCGCLMAELSAEKATSHGRCRTRTYHIWGAMKTRCTNKNYPQYDDYGGRGITVCERWLHSFENFLADMGECPDGLTIERRNNDAGYCKDNCKWATRAEQNNNKRNSVRAARCDGAVTPSIA